MSERPTNALIHETSPYLLQHAHNPVDWKAYNQETLSEAQKLGKPLIISIGYSACHWCHVMEHESFEDSAVAAYMNEYFTCIKVDREERPDVDQIYMSAVQMITGRGGWPLNCFALPDGRPFHGGTYFPKPNWLGLLQTVHHEFTNNTSKLEEYAGQLMAGLEAMSDPVIDGEMDVEGLEVLDQMVSAWKPSFDSIHGGVSKAPKFPMPSNYLFLLHYGVEAEHQEVLDFVDLTLTSMAMGGIHDHVGGGFARYAVDEKWKVPHFEKMAYDNAQLLELYAEAYAHFKNPLYREVCEGIVSWIERELTGESGLIYSALDADSEGVEGKFYTFTKLELQELLSEDDFNFAQWVFQLDDGDVWEDQRFILERRWSDADLAAKYSSDESTMKERRQALYSQILEYRNRRVKLGLDHKILCSWNALFAASLVKAGVILERSDWTSKGEKLLYSIRAAFNRGTGNWNHSKTDETDSTISGLLEDPLMTLRAATVVADYLGDNELSRWVESEMKQLVQSFFREDALIFNMVSSSRNDLVIKPVEVFDSVIPSVNSVAIEVISWLEARFGPINGLPSSKQLLSRFMNSANQYPSAHSHFALQQLKQIKLKDIVITGSRATEIAHQIYQERVGAYRVFHSEQPLDFQPFTGRFEESRTQIFVCQNRTCDLPITKVEDIEFH